MKTASKNYTDHTGREWRVTAEIEVVNGRSEVVSVRVQPRDGKTPVTRRVLSGIPIETLFAQEVKVQTTKPKRATRGQHRGREHSDEELQQVADVYLYAYRNRVPVQQAVADALGVCVSTATKRIMKARRRGLIPVIG